MKKWMLTPLSLFLLFTYATLGATPLHYDIDPSHTYASFEADHLGISVWRGKFNTSSGSVKLDKAAGTGSVEAKIDATSIDFGHDELNRWAVGKELLDAVRYPDAVYKGELDAFVNGAPTRVDGLLTLHGIARPVTLILKSFKCIPHPMFKLRELCGADAYATIRRDQFGLDAGKDYGFDMNVVLRLQIEALQTEATPTEK